MIWEAQYGDFINGAQVIIDEFIVSARGKWGQRPSLVLLLPHAHEGQGPDHASARPERFLQLAADINMRVANCTTAAQYFHLLRRQAALLLTDPLPLVVLTPKSLLRHPLVASAPRELAEGRFRMVIDDEDARGAAGGHPPRDRLQRQGLRRSDGERAARRGAPRSRSAGSSSCIRCRCANLRAMLDAYPSADEIVWVQEEPENMGAWDFVRPHLAEVAGGRPRARDRAAAQREPGGRIGGAPRASAAGARRRGASVRRRRAEARHETGDGAGESQQVGARVVEVRFRWFEPSQARTSDHPNLTSNPAPVEPRTMNRRSQTCPQTSSSPKSASRSSTPASPSG